MTEGHRNKPSGSFQMATEILRRESATPAAGTIPATRADAWALIRQVETDVSSSDGERKLARALFILLSRTHGS